MSAEAEDIGDQDDVNEDPEQPEIEDDEMADMSAVADQVEQSAGAGDKDDQYDVDDTDQEDSPDLDLDAGDDRTSIGDAYCNVLGMGAAVAKDQYGSGVDGDRKDVLDDYAEIAKDLEIGQAVDDLIDEHGGPDSLTPGQTVIVMTTIWAGMVVMEDPEILEGLAQEGGPT